jgi:outer membrane receptor protein involved in Fe transport
VQVAQGNKPGGFNFAYFDDDVDTEADQFDLSRALIAEEEAITWEWGIKGNYLDGAVQANLSVFYIDWTNQAINVSDCIPSQTVVPCETQLVVDNAGESEVKGLELEATWFATDRLSFTLGYGYTDSKLEDYVDDELGVLLCPEECYAVNSGTEVFTDAALALQAELGNVAGKSAPRVPKHNIILSQSYQAPLQDEVEWFVRNDWLYESKKYSTVSNLNWAPSMWNWNFRVGLDAPAWSLALYVDNVTNEKSPIQVQDFPLFDFATGYLAPIAPDTLDPGIQVYQNAFSLLPRRTRNAGLVFSYRFGAMGL